MTIVNISLHIYQNQTSTRTKRHRKLEYIINKLMYEINLKLHLLNDNIHLLYMSKEYLQKLIRYMIKTILKIKMYRKATVFDIIQ